MGHERQYWLRSLHLRANEFLMLREVGPTYIPEINLYWLFILELKSLRFWQLETEFITTLKTLQLTCPNFGSKIEEIITDAHEK